MTLGLHQDDTPSLHVYQEPERGWYCFGCRRGGSVYDFAALALGVSTRGEDFVALRNRLCDLLDIGRWGEPTRPMPDRNT